MTCRLKSIAKRAVCLALASAVCFCASAGALAYGGPLFEDVPAQYEGYEYILRACEDGVMSAAEVLDDGGQLFLPEGGLTLQEFSDILAKAFYGFVEGCEAAASGRKLLMAHGIYIGIMNLKMNHTVSRYEAALMTANLLKDRFDAPQDGGTEGYEDIPEKYRSAVAAVCSLGIMEPEGKRGFCGSSFVTRAQAAELYCKTVDIIGRRVPLLLYYRTGECYERSGDWVKYRSAEGTVQYRIDIDSQFYPLESVTLVFGDESEHVIFCLDKDTRVIGESRINSGSITLEVTPETKYIAAAVSEEEESSVNFFGTLSDEGLAEKESQKPENSRFEGKYLSVIGDSLSAYRRYTPKTFNYPDDDVTQVSQMWWYLLAKKLGMNICKINAYAGSGVSDLGEPEHAASAGRGRDLGICGRSPDVVIVFIGCNDYAKKRDYDAFMRDYQKMLDDISDEYPEAKIYLCGYPRSSLAGLNEWIAEIAELNGLDTISTEGRIMDSSLFYDGTHPNAEGMKELADWMAGELLK